MARPGRPASESYQPVCCSVSQSVSYSSAAGSEGLEDEDDKAPIFSLSKSSMDVVMATGPPHKRDPAWTRMDLKRSSSTNTHSEQNSVMLQQLHPHMWQQVNNLQAPLAAQHVDAHGPPAISEHWLANMQRWSECSSSTHSRSSTPDTVVWKGGSSRPCSLTQEAPCSSAPDSPMSKTASPPTTPSPFVSPLQTPTLPPVDLLTSSFPLTLSTHQQRDSPATSPQLSPQPAHITSPLPSPLPTDTASPLLSPLPTDTASPLPSPLQAHTASPLPSPLQAHTASPLPSPLQPHTTSPLPSPLQAHTTSPLPSPLQAHTTSPLSSPLQAHTTSPLPSPLQAHTTSPLSSPLQAHTTSPLPSPLQAHITSPLPSPLQAHITSPLSSPLQAHTTSPLPSPLQAHTTSPQPSPLQAHTTSPQPSPLQAHTTSQLTGTDDEGFLENNLLSFQYPSPIPSSFSLAEGGESSDPGCLADGVIEELPSSEGMALSEVEGVTSPVRMSSDLTHNSAAEGQESGREASVCHLQLPWQSGQRGWRSPLVSSLSDSWLRECCRCDFTSREGITQAPKVEVFREEGTMTSRLELVDAAVQTASPVSSWWDLRRNMSTSNMGSHSILGSPPGSRLNLKSSVGSHSNLVSPSSSMFPVSSGEEEERRGDDPTWDANSASSHNLERRRSCLKIQGDDRDELGRRSSMKQVQWDEDGMTWDVHGASLDPEELSTAIRKHLELKNSPRPTRRTSKKKKAPKPPLISNAMAPEVNPPVTIITSTCMVEGESEETLEADGGKEVEEGGGGKKEETVEAARRISRAEGENTKKEEEEVYGEEGTSHLKSPSHGSGHSRKRSVIRSLRRTGWCGGSRKADN